MSTIDVAETFIFDDTGGKLQGMAEAFDTSVTQAANSSQVAPANGLMQEGNDFTNAERGGRDILGQFLANTSRGLHAYAAAILKIGDLHHHLLAVNDATLRPLMRRDDSPAGVDPMFNTPDYTPPAPVPPAPVGGN
ncbi:hypothetical protein ACFVWG_08115 [Kribbella sp. NPDC058245]|uniref:hypothetical protein n=1 Tax=Kribbella sp. NPDC058245 TaxID=3346399 RepID=UPI0036E52392